jgi:hypothetical protein
MSFSLCAVIAEDIAEEQKPEPIICEGSGQCLPAMHGLTLGAQVALLQSPIPPAAITSLSKQPEQAKRTHLAKMESVVYQSERRSLEA